MSRYNPKKVPYKKQDQMLEEFCELFVKIDDKKILKDFLKDLLNRQERLMLIRRFLIASRLFSGLSYKEIKEELRVGMSTISRIEKTLNFGRRGYIKILLKKDRK
ncbi:MAG: hypothetical protein ACD_76C00099G0008 [uncultured bacterium]|nr:MAG: hypothetical protein ACD_76C00099G0008 [uncultured bacterium]HBD05692.1 hypothetical protein [Candidatus Uhrbacteria bacterium]